MTLFRKILFCFFVVVYLSVCPLLILYALGYVYNPLKQGLVRTGVIRLSTVPSRASVYLEQSRFAHQTPTIIEKLLPGRYQIGLEKKGYKRWDYTVTMEAGKAVSFDSVLLIPNQWPTKTLSNQHYTDLFFPKDQKNFFLMTNSVLGSCFLYKDSGPVPLLNTDSALFELTVRNVKPIIGSDAVLISSGSFWDQKISIFNPQQSHSLPEDVTGLFGGQLPEFCWQNKNDNTIYFLQNGSVLCADIKTRQILPRVLNDIKGFGVQGGQFYMITPAGALVCDSLDSRESIPLLEDASLIKRFFNKSEFYRIEACSDKIIIFQGSRGDLISNVPPYTIASEDVIGYKFNEDENKLLYWTEDAVHIADFSVDSDESAFHERFLINSVHENANNIKQCFWAWRDSHILCNDADTIYLIEIEPQGNNHSEPICQILRRTSVFYDEDKYTLYYLEKTAGQLTSVRIIP